MTAQPPTPSRLRRAVVGFGWVYVVLRFLPVIDLLGESMVSWVGAAVLGLDEPIATAPTGSGDRLFDWVAWSCTMALALLGGLAWASLACSTRHHQRVAGGLRVFIRYGLAFVLLSYGFAKVFPVQFAPPSVGHLLQTYGDSSPMGLLWTFMGASTEYSRFTGIAEVSGGLLLLSRRTTTLGALVIVAVMSNVVMLNFCYDVPVKLRSTELLVLAASLVAPDFRRLLDVLLWNRATAPVVLRAAFLGVGRRRAWWAAKAVVIAVILAATAGGSYAAWRDRQDPTHASTSYEVERFVRDGEVHAPLVTDPVRWRRATLGPYGLGATTMIGAKLRYRIERSDDGTTLTLTPFEGEGGGVLRDEQVDAEHRRLHGTLDGAAVEIELRRIEAAEFLLTTRGFHWVTEVPFNR